MNVLSLFDGMSCCRIALEQIGITPEKYYAAEIDKFAIKTASTIYPDAIHLGSVTEWRDWDIDWAGIGLVTGGFPCQAWSMAGKQLGDKDERGMLFWVMIDIMKHVKQHNPKVKFLIENVKMKKEFEEYITYHTEQALGDVHKVLINSALVSAQNRNRYYWTNWYVEQPKDKGILLKDIIETNVSSEHHHSQKAIEYMQQGNEKWQQAGQRRADRYTQSVGKDKSFTLTANIYKGVPYNYFEERPCQLRQYNENSLCHHVATATDIKGNQSIKRIYAESGKSPTLTTMGGGHREPKILCGAIRGRYLEDGKTTEQKIELRKDKKTNTLTTVQKDNVVVRSYNRNDGVGKELDKAYPLNASDWRGLNRNQSQNAVVSKELYRKLTPRECGRLQTVPEPILDILLSSGISNTQLYKMFGNGWTIDVIAHIFKQGELNEPE